MRSVPANLVRLRRTAWLARAVCLVVAVGATGVILVRLSSGVEAHARLLRSTPLAGSALATAPAEIRLEFSEPVDPQFSRAELFTSDGATVATDPITVDPADQAIATIGLSSPSSLARGTYVLAWRVLSAVDGHVTTGSLPFSIGTGQTAGEIGATVDTARPPWWRVAARWVGLGSFLALVGGFSFGLLARSINDDEPATRALRRTWRAIWWSAAGLSLTGMAFALIDQGVVAAGSSFTDPPPVSVYRRILDDSTFGSAWLARLALLLALCSIAVWIGRSRQNRVRGYVAGVALGIALLATIPFAGHAAAEEERGRAIFGDWLHLVAGAFWLGGLVYLLASLLVLARDGAAASARAGSRLIGRFSRLAATAVTVLIVSGLVNAAFHVAGQRSLRDQDYGKALIAKSALVLLVLIAAGVNLLVNRTRLKSLSATGNLAAVRRQLASTAIVVAVELGLGMFILGAGATLTELPPADAPLTVDVAAKTTVIDQGREVNGLILRLFGRLAGEPSDRFTISLEETGASTSAPIQRVIVESTLPSTDVTGETISDRFDAEPLPDDLGSFTFPASRLGLQGLWDVRVIVRRAGVADVDTTFAVDTSGSGVLPPRLESDDWKLPRITIEAWSLFALAAIVVAGGVVGVRRLPGLEPLAAGLLLTMVALIAIGFAVSATRLTIPVTAGTNLTNPMNGDLGSVQRGETIYAANCLVCHGPDATGATTSTDPAHQHGDKADLTDRRSRDQRDGDLYHVITYGIPGSDMPAYEYALTDDERWDVVNFVRELQRNPSETSASPSQATQFPDERNP